MKVLITFFLFYAVNIFAQSRGDSAFHISLPANVTFPIDIPIVIMDTAPSPPEPVPDSGLASEPYDERQFYAMSRASIMNNEYQTSGIEVGYVGKFRGKKIFFETGHIVEAVVGNFNYLLLRTDTNSVDSFDICFVQDEDTILMRRLDSIGVFRFDSTLKEKDFPSLFQILIYHDDIPNNYRGLNTEKDERIYFHGNKLFIQHWKRYHTGAEFVRDTYQYDGNRFKFQKSKLLQEVDYFPRH
jgi:hypothetical protein